MIKATTKQTVKAHVKQGNEYLMCKTKEIKCSLLNADLKGFKVAASEHNWSIDS